MGYTHYFRGVKDIEPNDWKEICNDFKKVLDNLPDGVQIGGGAGGDLPINKVIRPKKGEILFNGVGDEAYETMLISKENEGFNFCKTASNPYDIIVCSLLLIVEDRAPYSHKISSDGDVEDWLPAHKYCCNLFKRPFKIPEAVINGSSNLIAIKQYNDMNQEMESVINQVKDLNEIIPKVTRKKEVGV